MRPIYIEKYLDNQLELFQTLKDELEWISVGLPRKEYFMASEPGITYVYGSKSDAPVYQAKDFHPSVEVVRQRLNEDFGCQYNACFLNRYDTGQDQLGYHADDSLEMDQKHSICVISLGELAREIWWRKQGEKGLVLPENRQLLAPGSYFEMPSGFQQLFFHRIPKSDNPKMKPRISLTFRHYIKLPE